MIEVKSKDLKPLGRLENAYGIKYDKSLNELGFASFTLPIDDPKRYLCESFNVIEITDDTTEEFIGTFRIVPESTSLRNNEIKFECEHVISTLLHDILFRYHQRSNFTTEQNIQYILDQQTVKNWVKGEVAFTRYFHYKFENENGLLAPMLSLPKPFDVPYEWTYDTTVYPWVLNLVEPSTKVVGELRWGKNMGDFDEVIDPSKIVNRIYPLGAGEGVNQLGIESVNGGVAYLEDAESIAKYGLKPYVWVDRRIEDAQSLMENGQSLLNQWKIPKISFKAKGVDLSISDGYEFDKHRVGNLIRIVVPDREDEVVRIISESKSDLTGSPEDIVFDLNNKVDDIATTQTDIKRKQQVNDAYSQGATNILNSDRVENADPTHPIIFKVKIPSEAVNVNYMELTYETDKFRAYSKGVKSGGAFVKSSVVKSESTSSGGGQTTTSGGGQTTTSGGGQTTTSGGGQTTTSGGVHRHKMFTGTGYGGAPSSAEPLRMSCYNDNYFYAYSGLGTVEYHTEGSSDSHSHAVSDHSHAVSDHSHAVSDHSHAVSDHTHDFSVEIPAIDIPDHTHPQVYGIYEHATLPTKLEIKVDGNILPETALSGENIDLTPYLTKDDGGRIVRNRFAVVEIRPIGDIAQISASIIWGVFAQSHKGKTL